MRTSVDLPDPLLKRAKALAQRRHTTLRDLIIQGLRGVLEAERTKAERYRFEDRSVGVGGLVDGIAATDWDEIRHRAYEGRGG